MTEHPKQGDKFRALLNTTNKNVKEPQRSHRPRGENRISLLWLEYILRGVVYPGDVSIVSCAKNALKIDYNDGYPYL